MPIDPDRLRKLRTRKTLSRQKLADKSKISLRQIARLENESVPPGVTRERTVTRLAEALDVEPGVLLGELPMPEWTSLSRTEPGARVQVSASLLPKVRLAYELIKRRYGVNPTTLFNAAPLMFVLLAEGSILWRREKLKALKEAADQLHGLDPGHLFYAFSAYLAEDGVAAEEDWLQKRDLFGSEVADTIFKAGFPDDRSTNNPFANYLRELAEKIDASDIVEIDESELGHGPLGEFPLYKVCAGDLEKISGGSPRASSALALGSVRISDIPDELWADDATDRRAKWIEDRHPDDPITFECLFPSSRTDEKEASQ